MAKERKATKKAGKKTLGRKALKRVRGGIGGDQVDPATLLPPTTKFGSGR